MRKKLQTETPRWHLLYYVLAGFDLVTIAFSLHLNHKILRIYTDSTRVNAEWVARAETYEELSRLAGLVNAPGNDVFDSHQPAAEKAKKSIALDAYNAALENARADILKTSTGIQNEEIGNQLNKIDAAMAAMNHEADLIFSFFEKKDSKKAGTRMATMDRRYSELNAELSGLRRLVRKYQKDNLYNQELNARSLAQYEYLIAGVILFIVILVALYGHWLSIKISETSQVIQRQRSSLESSARLASLGTMSAGIAHEINNPLAIIQTNAQVVQRRAKVGEPYTQSFNTNIERIVITCDRIASIVKGLRSFARDGSLDTMTNASIDTIFEDSVSFCRERFKNSGITLNVLPTETHHTLQCRQIQICQVIVNLLNNSYDAVVDTVDPWVELSAEFSRERVKIFVKDSGHGIPKEIRDKIMAPFFTTKDIGKGTGLGLSISHSTIEDHNGTLYVDHSCPNTLFVADLPLLQTQGPLPVKTAKIDKLKI